MQVRQEDMLSHTRQAYWRWPVANTSNTVSLPPTAWSSAYRLILENSSKISNHVDDSEYKPILRAYSEIGTMSISGHRRLARYISE